MKKSDRELIRQKFGGRCAYCGCKLQKNWHVDEVEPIQRRIKYKRDINGHVIHNDKFQPVCETIIQHPERLIIDNQFPSCPSCNMMKKDYSIEGFRCLIQGFIKSLNSYSVQYKLAKKYGLIQETGKEVKFYFETYERY